MIVYKEKQFLVFDFEDGKTVKYDFATKTCIGKRGKPVKSLCSQLQNLTVREMCDKCMDKNYADFIRFVQRKQSSRSRSIENIGTIIDYIPHYSMFEQFFSAGIGNNIADNLRYSITDIPKGLIKICRNNDITITNELVEKYIKNPDIFNLALSMEFRSLTVKDVIDVITYSGYWGSSYVESLINNYGYNAKSLFNYIDYLVTYEGLTAIGYSGCVSELYDYANMMHEISDKFDKYPKYFLTTHTIASRNYNRLKKQFEEDKFKERIDKSMEKTFGDYTFIYPESTQDIKDEASAMSNCVASYIDSVINGHCHIMFLRKTDTPDVSLVTIEVRDNKIVQALQKYNNPLTKKQREVVDMWNKWRANQVNKNAA